MTELSPTAEKALRSFGWTLGPEFERRYLTDPWVFNLVNALERYALRVDVLEAGVRHTIGLVAQGADGTALWWLRSLLPEPETDQ